MEERHTKFMTLALEQAEIALKSGEIPVGCVFVDNINDTVIASGSNKTNETRNGTSHAEINALNTLIKEKGLENSLETLKNCDLYVTCEPCIMCAAALKQVQIKTVIFGCSNERFGGNGSILSIHNDNHGCYCYDIITGVMNKEAVDIFQTFYESENRRAPESKRRKKNPKGTIESL